MEIMYTAVARSCPKNIVMLRSRRTRIVILNFEGVTATNSLRNTTKHVKLLRLACFDSPVQREREWGTVVEYMIAVAVRYK